MPYIEMLTERNARRGFFERTQFEAVRAHLPTYAQSPATFAYINRESRIFPMTPELRSLLEAQRKATEEKQKRREASSRGCSTGPRKAGR